MGVWLRIFFFFSLKEEIEKGIRNISKSNWFENSKNFENFRCFKFSHTFVKFLMKNGEMFLPEDITSGKLFRSFDSIM